MASAGARPWLLLVGVLAGLLVLAGAGQLVCALYLLLKAPRPAVNGAAIAAGFWDVLVGLVTALLCFAGPVRASRRTQLQLFACCSAPAVNAALGVLLYMAPRVPQPVPTDVNTVCLLLAAATGAAAAVSFAAANIVFCLQLTYARYRPGTRTWHSPQSASSGASSFMFSQQPQMTQKPGAPDLWLTGSAPLASWVYRTQSSVETARCETPLHAPPPPPPDAPPPPSASRSSCTSLAATRPPPAPDGSTASRLPRTLSLLSAIYGPSRGGWPPTDRRPARAHSLLQVTGTPVSQVTGTPVSQVTGTPVSQVTGTPVSQVTGTPVNQAPFPPAPVPLCASPLPTPVSERTPMTPFVTPHTPLAGTIGRLTTALSRLHSDPNYRASRELQEALEALEALHLTPDEPLRPASAAGSHAASSGYGSPEDGPPEPHEQPERRSVIQLVSLLEAGRQGRGRTGDTPRRRPTVPPPPPPPGESQRPADGQPQCPGSLTPPVQRTSGDGEDRPVVESDC